MADDTIYQKLLEIVPAENILTNEPMRNHTSFRVGGEADFLVTVTEVEEIKRILELSRRKNIPLTVLGNGSNILVKDGGIRGITLKLGLKRMTKQIDIDKVIYTCESGLPLTLIAMRALEDEASGLEFAYGIPGTLGGAIRMNAGAFGGQMQDIVQETTYIDEDGDCYTINSEEHEFEYRNSIFSKIPAIILESKLVLKKGNKKEIEAKMQENKKSRQEKQPIEFPSAGSIFKRGDGFITAKIIDDCGLRGYSIGGAKVSEKHAGFIINTGEATAKDILDLVKYVKEEVKKKTNLEIDEEIQIVGEAK